MFKNKFKLGWRNVLSFVVALVAAIFIYMQWDAIVDSVQSLKNADSRFILLAVLTFSLSVFFAAAVVFNLRLRTKVKFGPILIVQTAGLFLGRVTPGSVGAIGAMIRHLVTQGHNAVQATSVMGASATATFIGNISLSFVALLFAAQKVELGDFELPTFMIVMIVVLLTSATLLLVFAPKLRSKIVEFVKGIIENLKHYKTRKSKVAVAIVFGALLTFMYGCTMLLVAYSLGVQITLFAAIITVSLGSLGVAVTPLPGGAVGAEAAIAATLVQFGVTSETALAIALVYRAITFWIPLLPGFIASQYALKKQYL